MAGAYTIWAQTMGEGGILSELSERLSIAVLEPQKASLSDQAIESAIIITPLIAFVILLAYMIVTRTKKIKVYQKNVDAEAYEAQDVVENTFENIHSEMEEYYTLLKNTEEVRELTNEEGQIKRFLATKFQDERDVVQKEIEDIVEIEKIIPAKKVIAVQLID